MGKSIMEKKKLGGKGMKIVIVGLGKLGLSLVEALVREGHDLTVIDTSQDLVEETVNSFDLLGLCGNGASIELLREANVGKANIFISATRYDEFNFLCCLLAKKLGALNTIARVRNPEYEIQYQFMRTEFGIGMMVNPDLFTANEISRILRAPSATKIDTFAKGRVELAEVRIDLGNLLIGFSLKSLKKSFKFDVLICAIVRGQDVFIPRGDFVIEEGDTIYVTSSHREMANFFKATGVYKEKAKAIMIIGGGRTSYYLAKQLVESRMSVKLIERDRDRCIFLNEALDKVNIVHGDGADLELLSQEGIKAFDALVSLTESDEENIMSALYAKQEACPTTIAEINHKRILMLARTFEIDSLVNPVMIATNLVLQYVRSKDNVKGGNVKTLYKLVDGRVEAIEFLASEDFSALGIPFKEMKLKANILIAAIIRDNKIIIPKGDDHINKKDFVICIVKDHILYDLEEILL